jgi:hypothetical protein
MGGEFEVTDDTHSSAEQRRAAQCKRWARTKILSERQLHYHAGLSEETEGLGGQGKRQGRQISSRPTRAAREVHVRVPVPVPHALWSIRFVGGNVPVLSTPRELPRNNASQDDERERSQSHALRSCLPASQLDSTGCRPRTRLNVENGPRGCGE